MIDFITVVIPVKNEEVNLPNCLESVQAFEHVVVVDSSSSDGTRRIAEQSGAVYLNFTWDGRFPKKRNWVLQNYPFETEWVLFLDADEQMTDDFSAEVKALLPSAKQNAFWISYRNWFMGRHMNHGDAMAKLCLIRVGKGSYERIPESSWSPLDMEIHEHLIVEGETGRINAKLVHNDKRPLVVYYDKHNAYSTWESFRYLNLEDFSVLTKRQRLKYRLLTKMYFPVLYFISTYIFKFGFLDGYPGFIFAVSKMFYFYQIQAKIREREHTYDNS